MAGIRVLVVDDNAHAREILTDALGAFSLKIGSASCGEDAIRELVAADPQDPYQLVLMDWHMPGMDGLEASRIIRRGNRLKHMPKIVMVTAFGREDIRIEAEKLGIDGYLLKPVSMSVLYDTLVDLFGLAGQETRSPLASKKDTRLHDARGIRLLLVEDNEVNQQVAREILESAGAIVTIANHGGEALEILTAGDQPPPFDVILMDLQMPEMDGFAATKLLRGRPELHGMPIIAMTADVMTEAVQRCLDAGMNDHVGKPIDPDALFATLARWTTPREVNTSGTTTKPVRPDYEETLPEFQGVDVAGGLRRVAGNKILYRNLLAEFVAKRASVGAQIASALESGDRSLAERLAHSVKGVAGNLGINVTFQLAGQLESAIRESRSDVQVQLQEFISELNQQVQAIQRSRKAETPIQRRGQGNEGVDLAEAQAFVGRLRALLQASDADATSTYDRLKDFLGGTADEAKMNTLGAAIGVFDFDAALLVLDEIAQQLGGDRKQWK